MDTSRRIRVCVGFIGVVLAVVIAETALALLGQTRSFLAYSESRGWRLRPGAAGWYQREGRAWVSINLDGLRGPHVTVAKPPGAWRVAVLGDSFVEAIHVPYEQTFAAVLERELRARCPTRRGRPIEVLNFGVSGYGTAQQLLTLREQAVRYDPDLVVLAIFTGNDISDNSRALDSASFFTGERCRPYIREPHGELVFEGPLSGGGLWPWYCRANFGGRRSAVLQLLGETATAAAAIGERHGEAGDGLPGREPGIDDAIYAPPRSDAWRDAWEITERLVATIAREVQARRAEFLAVILSNPIQVHPDAAHRARHLAAFGGTDLFYPERRIQALGAREGFEVLALAPRMQDEADRRRLFFHGFHNTKPGVGHWNAAGHDFAGRAIASTLCGSPG